MNDRSRPVAKPTRGRGRAAAPPRPRREFPTTPLAAAIVTALYPASATLAQRAEGDRGLEEIIVTATRRELNLQEVAQSITAFSTADIERQALHNVEDVIGALPSVNLVNSMPGRNSIIMRGISTGSAEYYTDSQVAVYLDDQPLTSISQQVDVQLIDIARVESLPGPQGTLFGSSSQSGTIRYITNKPDPADFSAQFDGEVGAIKGGEESYFTSGHLNIPVGDNFAVRVVGFYNSEGGYVDNVLGEDFVGERDNSDVVEDDWNDYEIYGGRIAARWIINPQWETTLSLISQNSRAEGGWESDPELGDYKITRFFKEYRDDDWYQASLNVKGDLGFAELSATASYFDRDIAYEWDDQTYDQWRTAYYGASYPLYDTDYLIGTTYNWQDQQRYTYEVRLTSQGESRFQWMAGAFYEDVYDWWNYGKDLPGLTTTDAWAAAQDYACAAYDAGYDVACPLPDSDLYYENIFDKTIKQKALFGEVSYDLTERWSVTGGARWFEYDRREVDISMVPQGLPAAGGNADGGRFESTGSESDTVFKFATQYKFDDDRMVYFHYSEGFRLGGNNSARAAETGAIPLQYGPDKLENYELGLKSTWLDDRVQLNVSAFLMEWEDFQLNVDGPDTEIQSTPFWVRGIINGRGAEQKGVEISGSREPDAELRARGQRVPGRPAVHRDDRTSGRRRPRGSNRRRGRHAAAGVAGAEVLGVRRVHDPRLHGVERRLLDAVVVQLPVGDLEGSRRGDRAKCGPAHTVLVDEHAAVRIQPRQRLGHRADRPQPVRRAGYQLVELYRLWRVLRRSALPLRPDAAAAAHDQPVLHQEMVTPAGMD